MNYFINIELEDRETAWYFGEMEDIALPRFFNYTIRHHVEHAVIRHFLKHIAGQGGVLYCTERPYESVIEGVCVPFNASTCKEGSSILGLYILTDERLESAVAEMRESEGLLSDIAVIRKYAW